MQISKTKREVTINTSTEQGRSLSIQRSKWQKRECNGCKAFCPECRQGVCCLATRRGVKPQNFLPMNVMSDSINEKS